ncbi:MAG: bifunctional 5,10-methylenetetrahydrofolate dehydrogenase/5,10-methenyltetrahydrofolate cyclohydrolase [Patescibacteria group bacterium]|nr:bifunctional 5,10-methylenetetrahydrofolate dehydrogenase/5,10-methenyltetrahydrofolate cyclohydrolase [Patescibacteria group bacterium]
MEIINGKNLAQEVLDELKNFFLHCKIAVAVISIGNKEENTSFIKQKQKAAAYLGIEFFHFHFDKNLSNKTIRKKINEISRKNFIKGIILQLPLSEKFNTNALANIIPINKDPDVLNERHFGQFCLGRSKILPPAVESLKFIFEKYKVDFQKKKIGVVGLGRLIGFPIAIWLLRQKCTVFCVDINTENPQEIIKNCDIVISGVGKANLIDERWIKNEAIVIDFGFEKQQDTISGDVNFDSIKNRVSLITPTPGGMGPILVTMIYKNLKTLIMDK